MKYCILLFLFSVNIAFSQIGTQQDSIIGVWSFSKRICIIQNDTIIQLPDPKNEQITDIKRPYLDLELFPDGKYKSEIAFFGSKGGYKWGTWNISELNIITFEAKFNDDPVVELNNSELSAVNNQLIFEKNDGCIFYFRKK